MMTILLEIQSCLATLVTPPNGPPSNSPILPTRDTRVVGGSSHEGISTSNTYITDLKTPLYDEEDTDCNKDVVDTLL